MLFDHFSEKVTFPRFEETITLLSASKSINLKKVFMEICGINKKYITFARLITACENRDPKESSVDLKNFFSHFMKSVIKVKIKFFKHI
jgi:hypothetical protein